MIRRSLLFIPGNTPAMIQNADVFDSDAVIIDLEDSVSLNEKDAARYLLKESLTKLKLNTRVFVRINPFESPYFKEDLKLVKNLPIDGILLPKASLASLKFVDEYVRETSLQILLLVETALGVEDCFLMLQSSERTIGLMLGGEDLCVDLNCERTIGGSELLYARTRVVNAAKALRKLVIDTPFTDVKDDRGLLTDATFARGIGFDGKAAIHPNQVMVINDVFSPSPKAIKQALRIIEAKNEAIIQGKGAFSLDGKMVDLPIIKRAEQMIEIATQFHLLEGGTHDL
jgi:citrate lyase subunit beta / citryl-CoA lyase